MDSPRIRPLWTSLLLVLIPVNAVGGGAILLVGVGAGVAVPLWGVVLGLATANCVAGAIFLSRIGSRLAAISGGARSFIDEGQTATIAHSRIREIRCISESLDQIRDRVGQQVDLLTTQRNEQESVLQSMQVGVIAIDAAQRVLSINRVAQEMLGLTGAAARGRRFADLVSQPALLRFAADAIVEQGEMTRELELREGNALIVRAIAGRLRDANGKRVGSIIVLSDVTHLKKLENLRTDFAANVSHELRTPITNIKGYVETLLDDGLGDPEQASKFLAIVARNADRLGQIIDDMLALTSLERADVADRLVTQPTPAGALLHAVRVHLEPEAKQKKIPIILHVSKSLYIEANSRLAEQAITNLISNAIKYCPTGTKVTVTVRQVEVEDEQFVEFEVADEGPGIAPEHLPRLFERFYRVDKARSREFGGTGLGLAIVKHIALVHGGSILVESDLGTGSKFRLRLPAATDPESLDAEFPYS
ncbi:MAG: sensor histidine kinase [Phycisphaerales bacterium]|nr:ATP-binding protein [bacterium]